MPNIYITDETKQMVEQASEADRRTQDGEIQWLCEQRIKELGLPGVNQPSVCEPNIQKPYSQCQGNNSSDPASNHS